MADPLLHDFETAALVEELDDDLQVLAEYNTDTYNDLFVADDVVDEFGGQEKYDTQRKRIEEFLRLDFIDRHAYRGIVPQAGESNLFLTQTANVLLIRLFDADNALFVSVERNGNIGRTIDAVEDVVR